VCNYNKKVKSLLLIKLLWIGIIPFKWIEYVDLNGNEFTWRTIFYAHFRGKDKIPLQVLQILQR